MDVSKLEPADRDPVKLRNTALILTAIMVVGGFAILWAYNRFAEKTSDTERPSFLSAIGGADEVHILTSDGERRTMEDLRGSVVLTFAVTSELAPESEPTISAVREVLAGFSEKEKRPKLLVFVLDGDEEKPELVAQVLTEFGQEPEVWRVPASEDRKDSLRAFLKSKIRFGIYPHEKDGKLIYDSQLVLLDQHLQIRGPVGVPIGWDFEKVAGWERQYDEAKKTNDEEDLVAPKISTEELVKLLKKSLEYLYENPDEKGQK
ncbi:MAG: hypothetical protein CBC46_05600 [Verrucomicrobiaceae bacterium TMED86]|nr:MAG: hypothetical protein CBC46_05600 [Verrucomicrobiaceae bacterium TMED86]